jgi:hypothetical protein
MEDSLNALIAELLGAGPTAGQAVTFTIRNFTDRVELARTLIKDKAAEFESVRDEALAELKKAADANDRRNTLIHHAITRISFNVSPDGHVIEFRKKDHRLREIPKDTVLKGAEFGKLTTDLRLLARSLLGAISSYRLARARAP